MSSLRCSPPDRQVQYKESLKGSGVLHPGPKNLVREQLKMPKNLGDTAWLQMPGLL
ncbi:MAG: hypothetical protein KAI47_17305 [Deltaproteobacteria bacterium]|nr:hypothetical protein [Deltaproteobacteria bacterium]